MISAMPVDIVSWLGTVDLGGNTWMNVAQAVGAFVLIALVARLAVDALLKKLSAMAARTTMTYDDALFQALAEVSGLFYAAVGLLAGKQFLTLPSAVDRAIATLILIALVYEVVKLLERALLFVIRRSLGRHDNVHEMMPLFSFLIKLTLWSLGILLVLSNLGVNVTSLIAGLGIGGVAIALAVQNILGDMFSSLSIYIDQPFRVGDFIIVGQHMGTVKKIGIKSTRISALQGEEIVIGNHELTSVRIQNFKRMDKRRVQFAFGVVYGTSPEKLRAIPDMVREAVESVEGATLDRAHFKAFGDSSLDFEVVYFVNTADYNLYMDAQQTINLGIVERFAKAGIDMAFPTRTVHLVKD